MIVPKENAMYNWLVWLYDQDLFGQNVNMLKCFFWNTAYIMMNAVKDKGWLKGGLTSAPSLLNDKRYITNEGQLCLIVF